MARYAFIRTITSLGKQCKHLSMKKLEFKTMSCIFSHTFLALSQKCENHSSLCFTKTLCFHALHFVLNTLQQNYRSKRRSTNTPLRFVTKERTITIQILLSKEPREGQYEPSYRFAAVKNQEKAKKSLAIALRLLIKNQEKVNKSPAIGFRLLRTTLHSVVQFSSETCP